MTGEEKALYQQIQNLERDLAHSRRETDDHRVQLSVKEEEEAPPFREVRLLHPTPREGGTKANAG